MNNFQPGDKVVKKNEKDLRNYGEVMDIPPMQQKPDRIAVYFQRQVWIKPENLRLLSDVQKRESQLFICTSQNVGAQFERPEPTVCSYCGIELCNELIPYPCQTHGCSEKLCLGCRDMYDGICPDCDPTSRPIADVALEQCDALLATLATLVGAATTSAAKADLMAAQANINCARGLIQSAQEATK